MKRLGGILGLRRFGRGGFFHHVLRELAMRVLLEIADVVGSIIQGNPVALPSAVGVFIVVGGGGFVAGTIVVTVVFQACGFDPSRHFFPFPCLHVVRVTGKIHP